MIGQVDYIQPYIQMNDGLPYVGGELERLTSATPFWRGQGIPIYNSMQQQGAFYGEIPVGLTKNDAGASVKELQQILIEKGFLAVGEDDGDFGKKTKAALKAFQASVGLSQTGIVDQATKDALTKKDWTSQALSWFDTFKKGQESTYKPLKDLDLPQSQYTPSGMDGKTMLAITAVSLVVLGGIYLATRD